jgi:hypothetical protein
MTALRTGLAVQRTACTRSALANIGRDFVAEFDGLKRAAAVERLAAIARTTLSGNMIALFLPELANSANVR